MIAHVYTSTVGFILRGSVLVLVGYGGLLWLTYHDFTTTPTGFIPQQDKGYLLVNVQLPDSASVQRTQDVMAHLDRIIRGDRNDPKRYPGIPGVAHTVSIAGQSMLLGANAPNFGSMNVMLKPFEERHSEEQSGDAIAERVRRECRQQITEALVTVFAPPPVDGLGTAGGFKLMVEDRGPLGPQALQQASDRIVEKGNATPGLQGLFTNSRVETPWLYLDIDRDKCLAMGVPLGEVDNALQVYLGSYYVNNFNQFGRSWQVNVQADTTYRNQIEDILQIKVRNSRGESLPLATLAEVRNTAGPVLLMRYNMYAAAAVYGSPAPGTSSGQAIHLMETICTNREILPPAMAYDWTELTYMQLQAGSTAMFVFALAVVFVFLVLAAQYESWSLPLAVILVVPMCLLCAVIGINLKGADINIFPQIGFVVLVGLASKNAILIVEFAKQERESGKHIRDATLQACRLRLRPILMTSFAFILGVVPLVIAEGAGAEMRRSLGLAVFSGMLGVTFFGIFLTPVFFFVIQWLTDRGPIAARPAPLSTVGEMGPITLSTSTAIQTRPGETTP
jgi:hydrophobe/amphiphile efflux-1 (HAE1) family protein